MEEFSELILLLTPPIAAELDRIMALTNLSSRAEVFQKAFTLLRIHVDEARKGMQIHLVDPRTTRDALLIKLPFEIKVAES